MCIYIYIYYIFIIYTYIFIILIDSVHQNKYNTRDIIIDTHENQQVKLTEFPTSFPSRQYIKAFKDES